MQFEAEFTQSGTFQLTFDDIKPERVNDFETPFVMRLASKRV
jgi:hypothetical protein